MKKIIALVSCMLVMLIPAAAYGETAGQRRVRDAGFSVEWLSLGKEYEPANFIYVNEPDGEGYHAVILVMPGGSVKFIFIDGAGRVAVPGVYDYALYFREGLAYVELGAKKKLIDPSGREVLDLSRYDRAETFAGGLVQVSLRGLRGIVDLAGNEILPCVFDEVYLLSGGLIAGVYAVGNEMIYGVFDRSGKALTETEYNEAADTAPAPSEGAAGRTGAYVESYGDPSGGGTAKQALFDASGRRLTGYYNYIGGMRHGLAVAGEGADPAKEGLINQYGAEILPFIFERIRVVDAGTCIVHVSDGKSDSGELINGRIGVLKLPRDAASRKPSGETPITVLIDGVNLYFDAEPVIVDGRTCVPMRMIFEFLGAEVYWNDREGTVRAAKGGRVVSLTVGANNASIDGKSISLDVPAMIQNGRALVPLRFVAEALDCGVAWEAETARVLITSAR